MYILTWFGKIFTFIVFILLTDAFANQILTMTPRQNLPQAKGDYPLPLGIIFLKICFLSAEREGGNYILILGLRFESSSQSSSVVVTR